MTTIIEHARAAWANLQPSASLNYNKEKAKIEFVLFDGNDTAQYVFEDVPAEQAMYIVSEWASVDCTIDWKLVPVYEFDEISGIARERQKDVRRRSAIQFQMQGRQKHISMRFFMGDGLPYKTEESWDARNAVKLQEDSAHAYHIARRMMGIEE